MNRNDRGSKKHSKKTIYIMNKQDTQPDPRQALFLAYYLDPKSSTFSNALQSGIRAGYSEEYSQSILCKDLDWLSENVDKQNMVKKAMRNLNKLLDEDKDKRILLDTTKFVAERIGKLNEETNVNLHDKTKEITNSDQIVEEVLTKLKDKKLNEPKINV